MFLPKPQPPWAISVTRRSAWFSLRGSLWLIPVLALIFSAACALVVVRLDAHFAPQIRERWPFFLQMGSDGARQILATIGSSMITVTGVVFSITVVALSLAANQYSPRVLRNFMRDRLNQTVLGVFIGVFIYTLLVMRTIGPDPGDPVPYLSVWLGMLFAIISIVFLIVFIHHTSTSIQVSEIIAQITRETVDALKAVKRTMDVADVTDEPVDLSEVRPAFTVSAAESGYVQDVDVDKLFRFVCEKQWTVEVECPVGDFVVAGRPLISVYGDVEPDHQSVKKIRRWFGINSYRTIEQDPAFGVRQIVDIALRALSPGINDATTAVNCVDYLGVILHNAIPLEPQPQLQLQRGEARVLLRQLTLEHLIDIAFNEIRQNAHGNAAVLLRMLRTLRQLAEDVQRQDLRAQLGRHARLVMEEAERSLPAAVDRTEIERAFRRVADVCREQICPDLASHR